MTRAAELQHEMNYHKLHIRRDGTVNWFEAINRTDDIIDGGAEGFAAVPSVITVGTGSCACNCDHCGNVGSDNADATGAYYSTEAEAIADAVLDADTSLLESDMLAAFDAIAAGYFDDEEQADAADAQ